MIEENHNTIRSQATLEKVFAFIEKYSRKPKPKCVGTAYLDYKPGLRRFESTPTKAMRSKGDRSVDDSSDQKSQVRKGI